MKVKPSIKPRCNKCYRVIRKGRRYIYCEDRRHVQRQG